MKRTISKRIYNYMYVRASDDAYVVTKAKWIFKLAPPKIPGSWQGD